MKITFLSLILVFSGAFVLISCSDDAALTNYRECAPLLEEERMQARDAGWTSHEHPKYSKCRKPIRYRTSPMIY